jgi:hypothetical protein
MSELLFKDKIATLEIFERDAQWYRAHYNYLKRKYGGKHIAINSGKVVLSDVDQDRLLTRLKQPRFKNKTFFVKYISKRDVYPAP